MGTIAQKIARALDTKEGLKDTINIYLGQDIKDAIPFKDYETYIKNFYNAAPKTEFEEGSDITLENTLKAKLDFEDGIVGIGDTSQKSYEGYNLLQSRMATTTYEGVTVTNNNDGTFTLNGTNTSSTTVTFRIDQSTRSGGDNYQNYENGTYTLDLGIDNSNMAITLMQNQTWTSFISTGIGNRIMSATISNATNTFIYISIKTGAVLSNVTIKPMLVKGTYTASTIPSFEPYVGGTASPNPSYPQDIEVVRGKNRLNNTLTNKTQQGIEFIVNEDKTIKANGTATGTSGIVIGQVQLTANETYTLSGCASNGGSGKYTLSISPNGETTRLVDDTGSGATYTPTTSGIYDIRLNYWYGFNIQNLTFKPMLEKGSQATSYLPYNTIEVKARGKNHLLCRTDIAIGYTRTDNGITWQRTGENTFKLNGTASGNFTLVVGTATPLMENLKNGETYTLSGCPSGGTNETYRLQIFNYNGTNTAYDTGSGATFVSNIVSTSNVAIRVFDGVTVNNLEFNVQIELGSTKTSFIPFEVTTKQLSLGNIELYEDGYISKESGKWYVNNSLYKVLLKDIPSNEWRVTTRNNLYNFWFNYDNITPNGKMLKNGTIAPIYCNYFRKKDMSFNDNTEPNVIARNSNDISPLCIFACDSSVATDVNGWLSYISTHQDMVLLYSLKTPTKIEITDTTLIEQLDNLEKLMSYTGTTILEVDGDLPLIIKTRALKGA